MEGKKEELSYTSAILELEKITEEIENASISMDELAAKVKRGAELYQYCQNRLTATEQEINDLFRNYFGESGNTI